MWARTTLLWGFLSLALVICLAGRALAELMTAFFPDGVPGYDTDEGVTVATRLHPEQMPLGVREDTFVFSPRLDQGVGYTSSALPGPHGRGSWEIVTAPSLTVASDWSRDAFGASVSLQDTRYLSLPSQDRTDGSVSAGGRIDIGDDKLTLAAAHVLAHEDRSQIDTIASDRPVAFQIDDVRASYAIADGRWTVVPSVQATNYTYSPTTLMGIPTSQAYRDRVVVQGGVTVTYDVAPLRSVVFVVRAVGQTYTRTPSGQPSPDSRAFQVLGGIDYDDDSVWRWRLLAGGEARRFASPLYPQQNTLIAEAGVGWSPSELTTVTAVLSRDTEDAAQEGVSGLVYASARLTIDHEYLRDLLFRASVGLQRADFFQGGHQIGITAGLGVTWVMNRNARLLFTYDQTDLFGTSMPAQAAATGYSRGVGLVTLRLGAVTAPISLLGLAFDDLTVAAAAAHIAARVADAPFGYVVTPNADHLVRLSRERGLRTIYRNAAFCLLDSRVVSGLARLFGLAAPPVVPGSDLTAHLLAHHLRPGERITIVGLSPVWLPALVARCGLAAPAHYDPPIGFERDPVAFAAAVGFVRDNPARFVFLAVGSPRQEYLAAAIEAAGDATGIGLCIGASLEFLAGARRRAPRFMRRRGLEWLFRLATEPRRLFRRYLIVSPRVIVLLLKQRLVGGRSGRALRE